MCLGRKNKKYYKDLHQQAYDRLTGMQAFGESKKEAVKNGTDGQKIFSFNTYQSYWKHTKYFLSYIKEKHPECTTLKSAKKYANEWLQARADQGLSAWTVQLEAKALGKLYGINPEDENYYYNKDLFAQAGIEAPPETWEEFEADCDKLLAAGITPISMDTADSGWCTSLLMGAMIGQTDTGEKFMNTNQPDSFVNDDVIQAAARIQKMFQNYTTTDAIGGEYGAAANNFFNEKTAIIANGPWMVSKFYDTSIVSDDFADKIAAAAYPGNVMYNSGQVGWSIASKTPEKIEASLAFVKFMTSEESQKMDLEMCSVVPDRSIEGADVYPLVNDTIALADKASHSINDYQSLWQASVVDEVSVQYPLLADGSISPEEFAEALTSAIS